MSRTRPASAKAPRRRRAPGADAVDKSQVEQTVIIPVIEERVQVEKKQRTARLRVRVVPRERTEVVDVPLNEEQVEVRRVPVNRVVSAPGPVRQEGDVTIVPVYEEVISIEKKLVLREEVHIHRRRNTRRQSQSVVVRKEDVEISRSDQSS